MVARSASATISRFGNCPGRCLIPAQTVSLWSKICVLKGRQQAKICGCHSLCRRRRKHSTVKTVKLRCFRSSGLTIKNTEVLHQLRSILRACTNLHTLSVMASDPGPAFIILKSLFAGSDGTDTLTPASSTISANRPNFPFLRNLELHFRLDLPILEFLISHHAALHVLRIHDTQQYSPDARAFGL